MELKIGSSMLEHFMDFDLEEDRNKEGLWKQEADRKARQGVQSEKKHFYSHWVITRSPSLAKVHYI